MPRMYFDRVQPAPGVRLRRVMLAALTVLGLLLGVLTLAPPALAGTMALTGKPWRPPAGPAPLWSTRRGGLVVNGSFETRGWEGWIQSGDPAFTGLDCLSDVASHGRCAAYFGPINGLAFLSQTVPTRPGIPYDVEFDLYNMFGGSNIFSFWWDGVERLSFLNEPRFPYTNFRQRLIATGPLTELRFGFLHVRSFWVLDDVIVRPAPGALPAPAGAALLAPGLGLVAARRLRRR